MRKNSFIATMALVIVACLAFTQAIGQTYKLTFRVDMSKADVQDPATVGIRGDIAPLSWTETYPMKGPDKNGIYTVTIAFEDVDYGSKLQYKYYHGDNNWDNDRYGQGGNRVANLCCKKQMLPVDEWDVLDEFECEQRMTLNAWDVFMSWVYTIAKGKERGLNMKEVAQENVDFWDWPLAVQETAEFFLLMDEYFQARTPFGYFEVIENSPQKVEYIKNKDWELHFEEWAGMGAKDIKGVTAAEMTEMFKNLQYIYVSKQGWNLSWQDESDHKVRIIITN